MVKDKGNHIVAIIVTAIMTRILQNYREIASTLRRRQICFLLFVFHSWNDISLWHKKIERRLHISKHSQNPGSQKRNDRAIVAQRIVTPPAIWCQGCWYFYNLSSIKIYNLSSSKPSPNVLKLDNPVIFQISRGEEICQAQNYFCVLNTSLVASRDALQQKAFTTNQDLKNTTWHLCSENLVL